MIIIVRYMATQTPTIVIHRRPTHSFLLCLSYSDLVVQQNYDSEVNNVYVIRKNSAILKCSIPSFVADFVTVVSWHDDEDGNYYMDEDKATKGINKL